MLLCINKVWLSDLWIVLFKDSLHCVCFYYSRGKWSRKDRSQQVHNAIHRCYHQSQSEGWSWKVSCRYWLCWTQWTHWRSCAQAWFGLVTNLHTIIKYYQILSGRKGGVFCGFLICKSLEILRQKPSHTTEMCFVYPNETPKYTW